MNREDEQIDGDLIDLGSIIQETKGGVAGIYDTKGLQPPAGISDID